MKWAVPDIGSMLFGISMPRSAMALISDTVTTRMNIWFAFPFVILRVWQMIRIIRKRGMAQMSK